MSTSDILEPQDIGLKVRESSNILLLSPSPHPLELDVCNDFLAIRPPDEVNVWCLGLTISPAERAWFWNNRVGDYPEGFSIVSPSPEDRSPADLRLPHGRPLPPDVDVAVINEPGNLTKIGVELTNALRGWADSGRRTMVCVHSVTTLMQYASQDHVFRFLHKVKNEIEQATAVAHYHMDPDAHSPRTIAKTRQLCDTVVEIDADEHWQVTTREFEAEGHGPIPTLDALD